MKFVWGEQTDDCCSCSLVRPGRYATEINIHNFRDCEVDVVKQVIPLVLAGVAARDRISLPAHSATMDDCCRIMELLLGAKSAGKVPLTIGLLEITSPVELSITAMYTVTDLSNGSTSIDVENVMAKPS